jgi:hypothetical protein
MKEKQFAWTRRFCLLWLVAVLPAGGATTRGIAETRQLSDHPGTPNSDFFAEKFACTRWVEEKAPDSKCLECHATIVEAKALPSAQDPGVSSGVMRIHAQHMRSVKVNFTCITCHKAIDPYQASSAGLRNQVPANMCFKCHFPHGQE